MFSQIRKRLTILYSSMLILIFILFIVIIYFVMSAVVCDEQKKGLSQYVQSEMDHYEEYLKRISRETESKGEELRRERKREKEEHEKNEENEIERRYFYYLVDNNGNVVNDKTVPERFRDRLFEVLNNWTPQENDYRRESLEVDVKERHLLIVGTSIEHAGQVLGYVYAGIDVTGQKHAMQRIVWILGGLAFVFSIILAIAGYYMAGRAIIPAQQAYEKQKQFVADASHELRTPLAVVYSSLEILEKDEKEKLSSFAQQMVDDLKIEVQLMTKLVSDLLLLARSDLNKIQLQYTTFDLAEIMPQIVRAFQPILSDEQVIELNKPEQLMMEGDRERIIQLLHILMDNAVKYTPKGKILLAIEQGKGKRTGQVIIRVQDEGIGISETEQQRIFDRFYRVDKARSREMGGVGLGLSIAKSIVDAHQGRIMVESQLGKGTTMTVSLPVRKK
jgi:two-component system sensor histidine kinase CiaH